MRIAFISMMNVFPWGGSEELWALTATRAVEAGHTVAASVYRWPQPYPHLGRLMTAGVGVIQRRHFRGGRLDQYISDAFDPLGKVWSFRPQVICVSQPGSYDIGDLGEATRIRNYVERTGVPFILVCQAIDHTTPPGDQARQRIRNMYQRASQVCFVAKSMIAVAQRHLAADIPNAMVVRNPVNLASTESVPWPTGEEPRFATVARLEPRKGLDLLLEVLRQPQWQQRPWRLRIYGDGPQRNYLPALAQHYGLADRVSFGGHRHDVRSIWADNHLMVLPSYYEGTALAIVEAMLCGRVPIVTNVGGAREWIEEGVSGFLAAAPTVELLSACMERAWANRANWPVIGAAARESAIARIDPDPGESLLRIIQTAGDASASAAGAANI